MSQSNATEESNAESIAESKAEARVASRAAKLAVGTPFKEMVPKKKLLFVLKVVTCVVSFGFIFPNVMMD